MTMNVSESVSVATLTASTAPAAQKAEAPQAQTVAPTESTTVTLSDEARRRAAMSVDNPGDWPIPPVEN